MISKFLSRYLLLACGVIAVAAPAVRADELQPNMCWHDMGEVGALQNWGADADCSNGDGVTGRVTCVIEDNFASCHYEVTTGANAPGAQVNAQFQCCNGNGSRCEDWKWSSADWTPPNSGILEVHPCTNRGMSYAKVSCLVAAPCD